MLTCARFTENADLQACAVDHAAHLTRSSSGDAVAAVQQAMIDLGYLTDDADGIYGGNTARAVLGYKTDRDIHQPGVPVDDIVGKLTIAYLDREIQEYDESRPGCFATSDPLAVVDLGGAPVEAPSALIGSFGAGPFVSVAADGQVLDLTGRAVDGTLLAGVAAASADLLAGRGGVDVLGASLLGLAGDGALAAFPATVSALVTPLSEVLDLTLAPAQLVAALTAPQAGPAVPARDLSKADALAQVLTAHTAGEIELIPDPSVTPPTADTLLDLRTGVVAGVTFKVAGNAMRNLPSYAPVDAPLRVLDPRLLLGLLRLCRHLRATWGVTEIHHVGVSGDRARLGGDCHQAGRACDLVGVRGIRDGTPFLFAVFNDWWQFSVPDAAHPGKRLPDWPHRSGGTAYRLADHPTVDAFRRDFWSDLYATIAADFQDRTQGPNATGGPTSIGQPSSIMTPDHPTSHQVPTQKPKTLPDGTEVTTTVMVDASDGREAHRGHVHFQIGVTGRKIVP